MKSNVTPRVSREGDPISMVIASLVRDFHWTPQRISMRLCVPLMAIEECLRTHMSSELLRVQGCSWLRDSGEVPSDLSSQLVAAALSDQFKGAELGNSNNNNSSKSKAESAIVDDLCEDDSFESLDYYSRVHYDYLRKSVGCNFISILTDPTDPSTATNKPATGVAWDWLNSAISESFNTYDTDDCGNIKPESVTSLFQLHPVSKDSFGKYIEYISEPYNKNLAEINESGNSVIDILELRTGDLNELPWPTETSSLFFDVNFSVEKVLAKIPVCSKREKWSENEFDIEQQALDLIYKKTEQNCNEVTNCLLAHVSSRSNEFFEASKELQYLSLESGATLENLNEVRSLVMERGESVVDKFIEILFFYRQRTNLKALLGSLEILNYFIKSCKRLSDAKLSLEGESSDTAAPIVVSCLKESINMRFNVDDYNVLDGVSCIQSLTEALLLSKRDIQSFVTSQCESALHPSFWETTDWEKISRLIVTAADLGSLSQVLLSYQQALNDFSWKKCIMVVCPELLEYIHVCQEPNSKRELLFKKNDSLNTQQYLHLLSKLTTELHDFSNDAQFHLESVCDILPLGFKKDLDVVVTKVGLFHSIQVTMIYFCESRERNIEMSFSEFEDMMRLCFSFIKGIVATLGVDSASSGPFRATLVSQCRGFIRQQHERQQEKMLVILRQETWRAAEKIEHKFQAYCDILCRSSTKAVSELSNLSVENGDAPLASPGFNSLEGKEHFERKLYINFESDGETTVESVENGFIVSNSILILLQYLYDNDRYLSAFPFLASDIITKIHDAIKLYDGQCAGMVLGAGAVDCGTLKTISVVNLAIASQCTGVLAELTPRIQARLTEITMKDSNKVGPFLAHLNRATKDLVSHRNEFMAKVGAMVREKIDLIKFQPTEWGTHGSAWVMSLLTEAARIIKHVRPIVRQRDFNGFIVPIISIVIGRVKDAIKKIPKDAFAAAKDKILNDISLLRVNFEKFGFDAVACSSVRDVEDALTLPKCTRFPTQSEFDSLFFKDDA